MTKLEELTALLVNEINDFKNSVDNLEKINAQLTETKIKMDLTEYKATIENHRHQMASCIKSIEGFENRFESKIKQVKIYPNWAVVIFMVSMVMGLGGVVFVVMYYYGI